MSADDRTLRAEVGNPVLALPASAQLNALSPEARVALRAMLTDIRADARLKTEQRWRSDKVPIAAYRKVVSV
ncbi:MAG: hypothetical protein ABI583_00225 [Betaproteobacteria bacterium]